MTYETGPSLKQSLMIVAVADMTAKIADDNATRGSLASQLERSNAEKVCGAFDLKEPYNC